MKKTITFSAAATILALGMIGSSVFLSKLFVRIKKEDTIRVKGFAQQKVHSDIGTFSCSYTVRKPTLKDAYDQLQHHKAVVLQFIKTQGFAHSEVGINNITTSRVYKYDEQGHMTNEIEYYEAKQRIVVTSHNVTLVRNVSKSITELIQEGIDIKSDNPRFYISDLGNIKLDLLARATKDGHKRALTLAENSGGEVGNLSSAKQGVFQITAPNSTETSGYGAYNTATITKTVKAVVTLEYSMEKG